MCSILLPFPSSRFQGWKNPHLYLYRLISFMHWTWSIQKYYCYPKTIQITLFIEQSYTFVSHTKEDHMYQWNRLLGICLHVQVDRRTRTNNKNRTSCKRKRNWPISAGKKNIEFRCFNDTEDAQHSMRPQFVDFCRSMVSIVCSSSVVWPPVAGHVVCLTFLYID